MEDDDEFGDLYTDVLSAFPNTATTSSSSQPRPPPSRPIDLNLVQSDDDLGVPSSAGHPPNSNFNSQIQTQTQPLPSSIIANDPELGAPGGSAAQTRVLHIPDSTLAVQDDKASHFALDKDKGSDEGKPKDKDKDKDIHTNSHSNEPIPMNNFGIEDELNGGMEEDLGSEPVIPGLHTAPAPGPSSAHKPTTANLGGAEADDWDSDSDSEDDLQIVLNDNNHGHGAMGMEANGNNDDDDDDEDGDPLVIVADDDAIPGHQPPDEQDWGDDSSAQQPIADGKDLTDASKPNAALSSAPKIAYNNFGYHPFHSQFKYVRPGATPLPGGASVGSGGAGQVRPPVNMGAMGGRGRGDWRPPGVKGPPKGFHPGFWGNNVPGRGLEFTLPSHKTIFDVDIDSFEEKPWKYPGIDVSDFFNFGLNEDSWKEYCKQLEQQRLESTMQSKIRVYESGRAEQEFDPDLPPELAAAAGIHDSSAENADVVKTDGGLGDLAKGSARVRPPLPTGRAIQVETGYGERLPSVDTRPPRLRDSDAVIEIVLQDSMDNEPPADGVTEDPENHSAREDDRVDVVGEDGPQDEDEYFDRVSQVRDGMKEDVAAKRSPVISSHDDLHNDERDRSSPQRTSSDHHSGSRGHASTKSVGSPYEERWTKGDTHPRSPHLSSGESALDRRSLDYQREDSMESLEGKHSPVLSSPVPIQDAPEPSFEGRDAPHEDVVDDKKSEKVDGRTNAIVSADTSKNKHKLHSTKQQKISSGVDPAATKEVDDGIDFKVSRSSDNSKATGSSRDYQNWREGVDDEVVQNGCSVNVGDLKRHRGEGDHDSRRKYRDGKMEVERNYMSSKGREEYYSHRDWDPYAANHFHLKSEGSDRRKERDFPEVSWQRRDEVALGRRVRSEDTRKLDRADEMIPRQRGKVREIDRSDKDEYLHSRKLSDNGSWRVYHEKDVVSHYREKDDSLKSRQELLDDHHSKRRKDDEHLRRDHDKEDMLPVHRESGTTRRKRERDDIPTQRKRDDQPRLRDGMDDHHRAKDEVWLQRERGEQRERDEWYRSKISYEENMSRREREDGRAPMRSSRNVEEKTWVGHSRGKEDYKGYDRDLGRHGEQHSRRDRIEDENKGSEDFYGRGNQFGNEGKRPRQERSSARNDRSVHNSENQRMHEKKQKDNVRKARESDGASGPSKRHQGDKGVANEMDDMKGMSERTEAKHDTTKHNLTGDGREDVSSDDDQHGLKRGRSKLERWTSHKERDYAINEKLSSSLKIKDINKEKSVGSGSSSRALDESAKKSDDLDKNRSSTGGKDGGGPEGKEADTKPMVDGHLDTVEKLKRRSERFKLPLTSEKDPLAVKKIESEPLPPIQGETPANLEVKQERPPRKRRWIGNS